MSEDNLEPLITQCPNCETRFRVTEAQLQVARGKVRCGACLGVFDGTAYLSLDGEEFRATEEPTDVDRLLEELDIEPVAEAGLASAAAPEQSSAAEPAAASTPDSIFDKETPKELLALEAELLQDLRSSQSPLDENDVEQADVEIAVDDEAAAAVPTEASATESAEVDPDAPAIEEAVQDNSEPSNETIVEGQAQSESKPELETPKASVVSDLRIPEPTLPDFEVEEEPKRQRSWFTIVLICLALVGLPAQVLWFQYENWVKDERFRPVYQYICEVADCELPPMRDVSKIVSRKSVIRVHPERSDARIVDVLMVNEADFPQPFPLIELLATTIRGQLVAGRRFKPGEYLQGEMAAADLLPPRTPVHVSLEIQDPGEDALNFEVRFR